METNLKNGTSVMLYNETNITLELKNGDVMVNLTEMAKAFGKRPIDFLRLPSTDQLIKAIVRKSHISENQVVIQRHGAPQFGGGTWGNRLIALSFAQWLDVDFHLLCLEKIEELLTRGVATVSNDDEAIMYAINVLQKRLEERNRQLEEAKNVIVEKEEIIGELKPSAEYTKKVLQSESTYTMTQVAKEFGMAANAFSNFLEKRKVIFRQSGMWMLFAKYDDKGYSAVRTKTIDHGRGSILTSSYLVWTEKGRMFLHAKFDKELNTKNQLEMFGNSI